MFSRYLLPLLVCAGIVLIVALGVSFLKKNVNLLSAGTGYDFSESRSNANPGNGPAVGDRIEIEHLKGPHGESLVERAKGKLMLLAVVDPSCWASTTAADQIKDIYLGVKETEIDFFLVTFTHASKDIANFSDYSELLIPNAPSFAWTNSEQMPPESIHMMVVPSFLLIDRNGKILKTFPGTSIDENVRKMMTAQTLLEVREANAKVF